MKYMINEVSINYCCFAFRKLFSTEILKLNDSNFIHPLFSCFNKQQYERGIKRQPEIGLLIAIKREIIFEEIMQDRTLTALKSNKSWFQSAARQAADNLVCTAYKSASETNCILIYVLKRLTSNTLC